MIQPQVSSVGRPHQLLRTHETNDYLACGRSWTGNSLNQVLAVGGTSKDISGARGEGDIRMVLECCFTLMDALNLASFRKISGLWYVCLVIPHLYSYHHAAWWLGAESAHSDNYWPPMLSCSACSCGSLKDEILWPDCNGRGIVWVREDWYKR